MQNYIFYSHKSAIGCPVLKNGATCGAFMGMENVILQMQAKFICILAFYGDIHLYQINRESQEERTKHLKCFGLETAVSSP